MVNPKDVNSLRDSMCNLLSDRKLWNRMRAKGLEKAKMFSWEKAAKEVLEVYDELCLKNNLLK